MSVYPLPGPARVMRLVAVGLCALLAVSCSPAHRDTGPDESARSGAVTEVDLMNQDATYVGEKVCLECHAHANEHASMGLHLKTFRANPRTPQQSEICEACHGPGSKHAQDSLNRSLIIGYTRDWGTPVAVQNAQCQTCHKGGGQMHWRSSAHEVAGVACSDCHNPMSKRSVNGALLRDSVSETCFTCHQQQRADFHKRSHMPLPEGKMTCVDCHNPHGSTTRPLLKGDSVNEVCYACHAEKRGPFIWEHAPVRENCSNCHLPHGSNNEKLLSTPRPWLCQQCHDPAVGHPGQFFGNSQTAAAALIGGTQSQRVIGRACQNCHTQVHGSNHPSGARFQR